MARAIEKPIWDGFPSDDVTCPNEGPSQGASFSASYMQSDIEESHPRPKGKYPAKFGTKTPGSGQFNFENDCLTRANAGETIWELPMVTDGTTWKNAGSTPGPYRVYYMLRVAGIGKVGVTYCGAYAYTDSTNMQLLGVCS